jgi:hypothetical protein
MLAVFAVLLLGVLPGLIVASGLSLVSVIQFGPGRWSF